MKIFYKEDRFFTNEEDAKLFAKIFINKNVDEIETTKTFDAFVEEFENCRKEGNSIVDSIEWSK